MWFSNCYFLRSIQTNTPVNGYKFRTVLSDGALDTLWFWNYLCCLWIYFFLKISTLSYRNTLCLGPPKGRKHEFSSSFQLFYFKFFIFLRYLSIWSLTKEINSSPLLIAPKPEDSWNSHWSLSHPRPKANLFEFHSSPHLCGDFYAPFICIVICIYS